jgi:hypothetical protein
MPQAPFPYDQLSGEISRGLARFLKNKNAASYFTNLSTTPQDQQEAVWLNRISLHMGGARIPPPAAGKSIYPVILYSFVSLFSPANVGWPLPRPLKDREVEKATQITTGIAQRIAEGGKLLVSNVNLEDAGVLPWDLVILPNESKARILKFIDSYRAILSQPILFQENTPFEIWRSDYYEQRNINGSISMIWSGLAESEREANMLGDLLLEYFTTTCNEDILFGCLWGNEDSANHEIYLSQLGSLTPAEEILERQIVLERRDLDVTFRAVATVERKRPTIESVLINLQNLEGVDTELIQIAPPWQT